MAASAANASRAFRVTTFISNIFFFLFLSLIDQNQAIVSNSSAYSRLYAVTVTNYDTLKGLENGAVFVVDDEDIKLRLFGQRLDLVEEVRFITYGQKVSISFNSTCNHPKTEEIRDKKSGQVISTSFSKSLPECLNMDGSTTSTSVEDSNLPECSFRADLKVSFPLLEGEFPYYICIKQKYSSSQSAFVHQGTSSNLAIYTKPRYLLALWIQILMVCMLLFLSGLFSGLNLGLMALDKTELKIVMASGTERDKKYAKRIEPLRRRGNFLLCSLLLGNVLVNTSLTILLDDIIGSGLQAVIFSTLGIVIFGEIVPQSICSRHGLAVGANTIFLTYFFMAVTSPLAFPISLLLDFILGEEIGAVYNRDRLKELVKINAEANPLDTFKNDEVNIVIGALALTRTRAKDIMTDIADVHMVPYDSTVLDFPTIQHLQNTGYTRIPVHAEDNKDEIVGVLNIKDLALVDPTHPVPLKLFLTGGTEIFNVDEQMTLDTLLTEFKTGNVGHIAFVYQVEEQDDRDPIRKLLGIVTLEDVIEEIIQAEIVDETDTIFDNRTKEKRNKTRAAAALEDRRNTSGEVIDPVSLVVKKKKEIIPPHSHYVTVRFLTNVVEPFFVHHVTFQVLSRLINQPEVYHKIKLVGSLGSEAKQSANHLYWIGQPADYFIIILEGQVRVENGYEKLTFGAGPFSYYGCPALISSSPANHRTIGTAVSHAQKNSITDLHRASMKSLKDGVVGAVAGQHKSREHSSSIPNWSPPSQQPLLEQHHQRLPGVSGGAGHHGAQQQQSEDYIPDYSVIATSDLSYIKITRLQYQTAVRISDFERRCTATTGSPDILARLVDKEFDEAWRKICKKEEATAHNAVGGGHQGLAVTDSSGGGPGSTRPHKRSSRKRFGGARGLVDQFISRSMDAIAAAVAVGAPTVAGGGDDGGERPRGTGRLDGRRATEARSATFVANDVDLGLDITSPNHDDVNTDERTKLMKSSKENRSQLTQPLNTSMAAAATDSNPALATAAARLSKRNAHSGIGLSSGGFIGPAFATEGNGPLTSTHSASGTLDYAVDYPNPSHDPPPLHTAAPLGDDVDGRDKAATAGEFADIGVINGNVETAAT